MNTEVHSRVQRIVAHLKKRPYAAGSCESVPVPSPALLPVAPVHVPRDTAHRLDSPGSIARLRQHGLAITPQQCQVFDALRTRWRERIVGDETGRCIIEHRFEQDALDGYFVALEAIYRLGPHASMTAIVDKLSQLFGGRRAALLSTAVQCGMFSLELADEVWRQMELRFETRRRDDITRSAAQAYLAARGARDAVARARG